MYDFLAIENNFYISIHFLIFEIINNNVILNYLL